mgnify:CR=1 FL=1
MRVLEVLREEEKPLRLINPDELDITNPEEDPKSKIEPNSKKSDDDDSFARRAKRFGVTQASLDKFDKKADEKKWQTTAFSFDAWYLIFHLSNHNRFKDQSKGFIRYKLDYWYKKLVTLPDAYTTTNSWAGDASRYASISLKNKNSAEGIINELRGRVQNTLGITLSGSWEANSDGMKNLKKDWIPFGNKFLSVMGAGAIVPDYTKGPGEIITQKDRDTTPELTDADAKAIATKLEKEFNTLLQNPFTDTDDQAILAIIFNNITANHQWDKLKSTYKKMYKTDLMDRLLNDLSDRNELELSKHLIKIGSEAIDTTDISSYDKRRDSFTFRKPIELKATVKEFEKLFLKKEPKYAKIIKTKSGSQIWSAFMTGLMDDLKIKFQKENSLTLGELKKTWVSRIDAFKLTAKKL